MGVIGEVGFAVIVDKQGRIFFDSNFYGKLYDVEGMVIIDRLLAFFLLPHLQPLSLLWLYLEDDWRCNLAEG